MAIWWHLAWLGIVVASFLIGRCKGFWTGFFHARACLPHTRTKVDGQNDDGHGTFRTCPKCGSHASIFTLPWGV